MTMTLARLTEQTGLEILDHLDREVTIPVLAEPQAQGDLLVAPLASVADDVTLPLEGDAWRRVTAPGVELLRSAGGGNPHTLVAEEGTCRWAPRVADRQSLAVGALHATRPVYLIHPEHGASGIAPGTYVVRRQREGTSSLYRTRVRWRTNAWLVCD